MNLSERDFQDFIEAGEAEIDREATSAILSYEPYPKQREFHAAGAVYKERMARAGNRCGKTFLGAAEWTYHLTGDYPEWWEGRRWDRPIRVWIGGPTAELTRDGVQSALLGDPDKSSSLGFTMTGSIPASAIGHITRSSNPANSVDQIQVKHRSGGKSLVTFKNFAMSREAWQSAKLDGVWFDEEPPWDIYDEGAMRTQDSKGLVMLTFTPLKGATDVVERFMNKQDGTFETVMTAYDCPHLDAEAMEARLKSKPHMIPARIYGEPVAGEGRVYPVERAAIEIDAGMIKPGPRWKYCGALDFGWSHPTAAVQLVRDPDTKIVYVLKEYKQAEKTPTEHTGKLKYWGGESVTDQWMPWAWGKEALQTEKGSGETLKDQFKACGLRMMDEHAQFDDKSVSVESGISLILEMMLDGTFKVSSACHEWFKEFEQYSRRATRDNDRDSHGELRDTAGGEIIKRKDDLMDATRYGIVMLLRGFGRSPESRKLKRVERLTFGDFDPSLDKVGRPEVMDIYG